MNNSHTRPRQNIRKEQRLPARYDTSQATHLVEFKKKDPNKRSEKKKKRKAVTRRKNLRLLLSLEKRHSSRKRRRRRERRGRRRRKKKMSFSGYRDYHHDRCVSTLGCTYTSFSCGMCLSEERTTATEGRRREEK